jgi:hypothetical protein
MPFDASATAVDGLVRGFLGYGVMILVALVALALVIGNGAVLVRAARAERKQRKPRRKTFRTRGQEAVHASHFA